MYSIQVIEIGMPTTASAFPENTLCPENSTPSWHYIRSMKEFQVVAYNNVLVV